MRPHVPEAKHLLTMQKGGNDGQYNDYKGENDLSSSTDSEKEKHITDKEEHCYKSEQP